jgi:hypothetical protein
MGESDVVQITVDGHGVGIIGLKTVLSDMAEEYGPMSDEQVEEELLQRLRRKNYIPDHAVPGYKKAFLREFRKSLNQPFEEDPSAALEIKVLGPGCVQCDRLERELMNVLMETNLVAHVEHIRDSREIGQYGVMGTPALIINGEVKSVGSVPARKKLLEWLEEAGSA